MTSNDLEMTFKLCIFNIYDFWSKVLAPNNTKMEITPPYYHRHHTLVYIFKKICSEKTTFEIVYEVSAMEVDIGMVFFFKWYQHF